MIYLVTNHQEEALEVNLELGSMNFSINQK